jgi:hypothetical protein
VGALHTQTPDLLEAVPLVDDAGRLPVRTEPRQRLQAESEAAMSGIIHGKPTRIWFLPIGAETLDTDGGQLWYATKDGLGSVADMSQLFVPGSIKFTSSDEDHPIAAAASVSRAVREGVERAAQMDRLRAHGRAVGLTDEQTTEVIDAWVAWYQARPWPLEVREVRAALTLRASGGGWRP